MKKAYLLLGSLFVLSGCGGKARGGVSVGVSFPITKLNHEQRQKQLPEIKVVKRRAWSVREIDLANTTPMGTNPEKITVHHTTESDSLAKVSDAEFLRMVERYHQDERDWACIGYHFVIGRDGTVYEGRPLTLQGAHARGNNELNIGIALMGDFENNEPAEKQVESLKDLVVNLRLGYDMPTNCIFGHGELCDSLCPGINLQKVVDQIRK